MKKYLNPTTICLGYQTTLREAIKTLKSTIKQAVKQGSQLIVLDQEAIGKVMPSLMATTIAHDVLVDLGKRLEVRLVVKTGRCAFTDASCDVNCLWCRLLFIRISAMNILLVRLKAKRNL